MLLLTSSLCSYTPVEQWKSLLVLFFARPVSVTCSFVVVIVSAVSLLNGFKYSQYTTQFAVTHPIHPLLFYSKWLSPFSEMFHLLLAQIYRLPPLGFAIFQDRRRTFWKPRTPHSHGVWIPHTSPRRHPVSRTCLAELANRPIPIRLLYQRQIFGFGPRIPCCCAVCQYPSQWMRVAWFEC